MKLIITRHGQTDENVRGIKNGGESDALLNEEGRKQAKKLGHALKHEKISHAYVSPQLRAKHTAQEILAHHHNVTVIDVDELREQNLGNYESLPKEEFKKVRQESGKAFHEFKPERGESYEDVQKRAAKFFDTLIEKHHDDTILLVSHGGTTGMLLLHLFGKDITEENYKNHKPENTAVTVVEIFKDKPIQIHKFNDLSHLEIDIEDKP